MGKDGNRDSAGSLGERLVELRKKHGYSQQEIADRLSVTRQTISNWECGQGAPALDKAAELAAIYRIMALPGLLILQIVLQGSNQFLYHDRLG